MGYLLRPISFLLIVLLGCVLRRIGFLRESDGRMLGKIIMNVTLPCVAVRAFSDIHRDPTLLLIILFGLLGALVPMLVVFLLSRRQDVSRRGFFMLNNSGNNLGSFSLPIVQSFFGAAYGVFVCIYDIGNAIIAVGGNYAFTATLLRIDGAKSSRRGLLKDFCRRLFGSPTVDAYLVMLVLMLLDLRLPAGVNTLLEPLAAANPFLVMLMLGIMFRPEQWRRYLPESLRLIAVRMAFGVGISLLLFFCTPFSLEIRSVLALLPFAPPAILGVLYAEKCKGDCALSSFANSVNVLFSLLVMSVLGSLLVH